MPNLLTESTRMILTNDLSDLVEEDEESDKENIKPNVSLRSRRSLSFANANDDSCSNNTLGEVKILLDSVMTKAVDDCKLVENMDKSLTPESKAKRQSLTEVSFCNDSLRENSFKDLSNRSLNKSSSSESKEMRQSLSELSIARAQFNLNSNKVLNKSSENNEMNNSLAGKSFCVEEVQENCSNLSLNETSNRSFESNETNRLTDVTVCNRESHENSLTESSNKSEYNEMNNSHADKSVCVEEIQENCSKLSLNETSNKSFESNETNRLTDITVCNSESQENSLTESSNKSVCEINENHHLTNESTCNDQTVEKSLHGLDDENQIDLLETSISNLALNETTSQHEMTFTVDDRINLIQTKLDYENRIVNLEEMVDELNKKLSQTSQENQIQKAQLENDKQQLEIKLTESITNMADENVLLKEKLTEQSKLNEELKKMYKIKFELFNEQLYESREKEAELHDEIRCANSLTDMYSEESSQLKIQLKKVESQLLEETEKSKELKLEMEKLKLQTESYENVKLERDDLDGELKRLVSEYEQLKDQLAEAEFKFKDEKDAYITSYMCAASQNETLRREVITLCQSNEAEVKDLKQQLESSQKLSTELEQQVTELKQQNENLISDARNISKLENEKFELEEKLIELEENLSSFKSQSESLQRENFKLKQNLVELEQKSNTETYLLENQIKQSKERIVDLESALAMAFDENQLLKTENIDLQKELADNKALIVSNQDQLDKIQKLQSSVITFKEQLDETQFNYQKCQQDLLQQLKSVENCLFAAQEELNCKNSFVDKLNEELKLAKVESENKEKELLKLNGLLFERDVEVNQLKERSDVCLQEIMSFQTNMDQLTKDNQLKAQQLEQALSELSVIKSQLETKCSEIEISNEKVADVTNQNDILKKTLEKLNLETSQQATEIILLNEKIQQLNQNISSIENLKANVQQQASTLSDQVKNLQEQNTQLAQKLNESAQKSNSNQKEIDVVLEEQSIMLVKLNSELQKSEKKYLLEKDNLIFYKNNVKTSTVISKKLIAEIGRVMVKLETLNKESIKIETIRKIFTTIVEKYVRSIELI